MRRSLRVSMFNELLRVSTNSHAPSLQVLVNGSRCEHMRVSRPGDPAFTPAFENARPLKKLSSRPPFICHPVRFAAG